MSIEWLYGTINGKKIRINKNDSLDIYSWRECKVKEDYWYKMRPTLDSSRTNYKTYRVGINRKIMLFSRVVYKLHNKDWDISDGGKTNFIDHINQDSSDNRIENLRVLTDQQNKWNTSARGYSWNNVNNKWQAQIRVDRILKTLGYFDDEEDAHDCYLYAKEYYHKINV